MQDKQSLRLVLAARKSTKTRDADGREIDAIGIDTQDKRGRAWAERQGHVIVDVAADVKSGTVAPWDRPNLRPWVTDPVRMAQIDGVLAYRNDRLSRGCWADEARIRLWAEENRKVLVIVDGPQWPPRNPGDEWSWEAMSKQARREWEEARERSMRAQAELRERGKLVGRPPFGYLSAGQKYDHTIVPTEEARRLVPEVFKRCIDGESLADIAGWLATETGRPWWPRTVGTLIRNPTYIGRRCAQDRKTRVYGRTLLRCEPLVDANTFKRAGEALDGRPKRGPLNPANRAMLGGGVLFCPRCENSPMYRITTGTGASRTAYYRCTGRGSARRGCGNMVPAAAVDGAVNVIMAEFTRPVMAHKTVHGNADEIAARLEEIRVEIRQLAAEDLDDDEHDRRLAVLRAQRDAVKAEPVIPDRVERRPTGQKYSVLWAAVPVPERGPWLVGHGFRVTACKTEVAVTMGGFTESLSL